MIVVGLIENEEVDMITQVIKVSMVGARIRDLQSVDSIQTQIEHELFEEKFYDDLIECL